MPIVTFNRPCEVYLKGNPTAQRYEKGATEDSSAFDAKLLVAMEKIGDVSVAVETPAPAVIEADDDDDGGGGSDDSAPVVEKRGRGRPKGKISRAAPEADAVSTGPSTPSAEATVTTTAPKEAPASVEIGSADADFTKAALGLGIITDVAKIA